MRKNKYFKKVFKSKVLVLLLVFLLVVPSTVFASTYTDTSISFTNNSGTITINFPTLTNMSNKKYSTDGGNNWNSYTSAFNATSNAIIVARYTWSNNTYNSSNYVMSNTSANDGNWSVKSGVTLTNTPEAQLMYRIGDIDNFGYGFDAGFDPFSGNSTNVHSFPWTTPSDEPQGLDRIMEVSGYKGSSTHDGYTNSYNSDQINHKVAPVVLSYNLTGISVSNATIMMFVDDIQPGNAKGISGGNVAYTAYINGNQIDALSTIINNLDESGPIGRLISFRIPDNYLQLVRTGSLSILLDDKVSGCTGDGYAIDFVKLLVNSTSISNTCTINGTVTNATGQTLSGATISIGGLTTTTGSDGKYSLGGIPAGQAIITASKGGYLTATSTNNVIAYNTYTQNFTLQSTPKPGLPVISQDINVPTSRPVNVSITYPDSPTNVYYSVAQNSSGNDIWLNYTASFAVSSNLTVKAYSTKAGVSSDIASYAITNIDTSVPVPPTLTEDNTLPTNQDVHVTEGNFDARSVKNEISIDNGANWIVYVPVTISQNTIVRARSTNSVGTVSPDAVLNITNINKATPPAPTLAVDNANATNQDVHVTVTYPSGAVGQLVSKDNGVTWIGYSSPVVISSNTIVQAKYTNSYGATSTIGFLTITNIDKSKPAMPTVSEDNTNPTNQNVNISVDYPTGALNKKISIDDGATWTTYSVPVPMSSNNVVLATYDNTYGTTSFQGTLYVTNINKTVPAKPTLSSSNTKPTRGPVTITAVYSSDSVIKQISKDGGQNWETYFDFVPILIFENTTIKARSYNSVNTPSLLAELPITNIDNTPPTADVSYTTNSDSSVTASLVNPSEHFIVTNNSGSLNYTYTVNGNNFSFVLQDDAGNQGTVNTSVNSIGPKAGVVYSTNADGSIIASLTNQSENITVTNNNSSFSYTFIINGSFTFEFKDDYGNRGSARAQATTIKPSIPTLIEDNTAKTNHDVTVTATFPLDAVTQSIFKDNVQITNGLNKVTNATSIVVTFPVTSNGTITAIGTDSYNCSSNPGTLLISNIDKTAPTADVSYTTNSDGSVTTNLVNPSKSITVTNNGGSTSYIFTSAIFKTKKTFTFEFVDAYGNSGSVIAAPVDNQPVAPTFSQDSDSPATSVLVTVIPSRSGVITQYSRDGNNWEVYSNPIPVTVNNTKIFAKCISLLGTESVVTDHTVTNIQQSVVTPEGKVNRINR